MPTPQFHPCTSPCNVSVAEAVHSCWALVQTLQEYPRCWNLSSTAIWRETHTPASSPLPAPFSPFLQNSCNISCPLHMLSSVHMLPAGWLNIGMFLHLEVSGLDTVPAILPYWVSFGFYRQLSFSSLGSLKNSCFLWTRKLSMKTIKWLFLPF